VLPKRLGMWPAGRAFFCNIDEADFLDPSQLTRKETP
jgi:hypothetical protein